MKKAIKFSIRFLFLAILGFGCWKSYEFYKQNRESRLSIAPIEPKTPHFVLLVTAFNNKACVEKMLLSLFSQEYEPFRIVYLDLGSSDGSFEQAKNMASSFKEKISFTQTASSPGTLQDLYQVVHECKNEEIVLFIRGNDFLAHEHVLEKLAKVYTRPSAWMTYGNFLDYPSYRQIPVKCKQLPKNIVFNNSFRSHELMDMHLTTCYAGLFKQIKAEDFLYQGQPMLIENSSAYLVPLLEMSGKHTVFINEILYLLNKNSTSFDSEEIAHIKKLPKYKRLKSLP